MRRFWIEPSDLKSVGSLVKLGDDEFHHLKNVARLEVGEKLELLSGDGRIATGIIKALTKKNAEIEVIEIQNLPVPLKPHVTIALGVPRFQKMDLIIQKCVELGATRIVPMVSERSFMKTLNDDLKGKLPRWRKIALEACKQSGRAWPMEITDPVKLQTQIDAVQKSLTCKALFLYEGESALDVKSALHNMRSSGEAPSEVVCFIGAEGGFSPSEVEVFQKSGFSPVTLGSLVLRVETACIAILSVIQYEFGSMR